MRAVPQPQVMRSLTHHSAAHSQQRNWSSRGVSSRSWQGECHLTPGFLCSEVHSKGQTHFLVQTPSQHSIRLTHHVHAGCSSSWQSCPAPKASSCYLPVPAVPLCPVPSFVLCLCTVVPVPCFLCGASPFARVKIHREARSAFFWLWRAV